MVNLLKCTHVLCVAALYATNVISQNREYVKDVRMALNLEKFKI